jgi:predicted Zn finger-like uncharacterized protein
MRLVCPNCDAEYEVDASAIPDGGRDVQCSNCGNAWFQMSPEAEAELAAEEALFDAPAAEAAPASAPQTSEPPATAPAEQGPAHPEDENPPPPPTDAPRRSIDESVLAVLREEAMRETEVRKTEAPTVETQPDLGLEAPAAAGLGAVARRLARLKGEPEPQVKPQARRDMFPEIEEINSTLRASNEKRTGSAAAVASTLQEDAGRRSSFRSGFVLMLLLAVILVAAYVMAPKLAQQFPAAAGALNAYVAAADFARNYINTALQSAIAYMRGLAGGKA